jgi:hypothetical protein
MHFFIGVWWSLVRAFEWRRSITILAITCALLASACATTREIGYRPVNTCNASDYPSGFPGCLPPSGQFCVDAPTQSANDADRPDRLYVGQTLSLFPSKDSLGPAQPVCPPNVTRLVQEQDWKDARAGAKSIGHTVGRVLTTCEHHVERMMRHPDNILAGWNDVQPESLEAFFTHCTSELDSLPAIPQYDDPYGWREPRRKDLRRDMATASTRC